MQIYKQPTTYCLYATKHLLFMSKQPLIIFLFIGPMYSAGARIFSNSWGKLQINFVFLVLVQKKRISIMQ